jgi:TonB-dependent starch-binding outer membrane protein SusC
MRERLTCRLLLICFLTIIATQSTSFAQPTAPSSEQRVTGKVTDENTNEMPGVSVTLKGSNQGTTTDAEGNFAIVVPGGNSVLVFSYQGYLSQEVPLNNRSTVNIQLAPNVSGRDLNEVVVVGYGTQRKVDLTGSVASVTRKDFVNKPFSSPDQILGGRVPGVNITNRSGDPGAPIDVRIRGIGTTGNQPTALGDRRSAHRANFQRYR